MKLSKIETAEELARKFQFSCADFTLYQEQLRACILDWGLHGIIVITIQ